jgi:hypothetical protein
MKASYTCSLLEEEIEIPLWLE